MMRVPFSAPSKYTSLLLLREVPTSEHLLVCS